MKNKVLLPVLLLLVIIFGFVAYQNLKSEKTTPNSYDIVIYGGGTQGVAAALKASEVIKNTDKRILMIVPENQLGSILTSGGQNLFDTLYRPIKNLKANGLYDGYEYVQGGSMYLFFKEPSTVFSPKVMASYLLKLVSERKNIDIKFEHDIYDVKLDATDKKVHSLTIRNLIKDENNRYVFGSNEEVVVSKTYIDASETGRLLTLSGKFKGTVGREDLGVDKKQMVTTLMFKLKNLDMKSIQENNKQSSPFKFYFTPQGSVGLLGGYEINQDEEFKKYSENSPLFRLKPFNAGEDGYAGKNKQSHETEFWMNMLLVYDVDARKMWRDKVANNGHYPNNGGMDPEIAREKAIEEIEKPEFLKLIRRLPGLEKVELVLENGLPVVGDTMYLRESIHSYNEDGSFALTKEDTIGGKDSRHYNRRIGLGLYNFDSNTYDKTESLSEPRREGPWYVPYDVLLAPMLENVLVPGYAANIDSYAWRAMRVYPNLIVMGDAAGVAAGMSVMDEFEIKNPTTKAIKALQEELKQQGAILDR